jgi:long-chain acyl-CoA synthetase
MSHESTRDEGAPELGTATGRTVARLGRQVEIALAKVDLTNAQYRALVQLGEGAEASSSLAAKLAVSRPSATAVVEGLVQRGLVDRRHSADDRRRVSVTLTEAGRDVLAAADAAVKARLDEILAESGPGESTLAVEGVAQWGHAMDNHRMRRRRAAEEQKAQAEQAEQANQPAGTAPAPAATV